jgi:fructuronate reductase
LAGMMQALSRKTLGSANSGIILPPAINPPTGIVHLGTGAFHRAHQAVYTEDAMVEGGGDWGICGVSLRSADVQAALKPQDWLYTLAVLDHEISYRIVGALNSVFIAARELNRVLAAMVAAHTHIYTVTVTEKGYCLNRAGELNAEHPDIQRDLKTPRAPVTMIGIIAEALRQRFVAGIAAPTVISCDNLVSNGRLLANAVLQFARATDKEAARWIEDKVSFPCTMVDSITPATDDALRERVSQEIGLIDRLPVQREAFSQWVIENRFAGPRPEWEAAGAILTADVEPYEHAKLRLLNAAHSALAYLGSLLGIDTIFQAMQNQALVDFVRRMMETEISPTVKPLAGLSVRDYAAVILQRFNNPAIKHHLSQIAWDGSQKIPIRILETLQENLAAERSIRCLSLAVAGWLHFIRMQSLGGQKLNDPLAEKLLHAATDLPGAPAPEKDVARFLRLEEVFATDLAKNTRFVNALTAAYRSLGDGTPNAVENALRSYAK